MNKLTGRGEHFFLDKSDREKRQSEMGGTTLCFAMVIETGEQRQCAKERLIEKLIYCFKVRP